MNKTKLLLFLSITFLHQSCKTELNLDGKQVENILLNTYNLKRDTIDHLFLMTLLNDINCADSPFTAKKLVLFDNFHSADINQVLVVPYIPGNCNYDGPAFSNVEERYLLINPSYIREFALRNTLGDSSSLKPVLALTLLHEIGHFIMGSTGYFDEPCQINQKLGQQKERTEPQFITKIKKIELLADSLAIAIVKNGLPATNINCLGIAMDVQRILPGMQFQMSGLRVISEFGGQKPSILVDPGASHPNMELRISFMNYFLFPTAERKQLIDDYIYNRTVTTVHEQESSPYIFQGRAKELSDTASP